MSYPARRLRIALIAATVLAGTAGGVAYAQLAPTYDPAQLPVIQGKVAQYSLTPRGDVDGLILADGTEVHTPPHLGAQLVAAVKPGDAVTIHGLRARSLPLVQAVQVSNDAGGATVTDAGPGGGPHGGPRGPGATDQVALTAQGRVKEILHGPRGEANGALLEDGTMIHVPPPEAQRLAAQLAPGATVYVQGNGYAGPLGRVIAVRAIGPDANSTTPVAAPPPRHGPGRGPAGGPGAEPGAPAAPPAVQQ